VNTGRGSARSTTHCLDDRLRLHPDARHAHEQVDYFFLVVGEAVGIELLAASWVLGLLFLVLVENPFEIWRSQIVMSKPGLKMRLRDAPFLFTEHGLMAASGLNTPRAFVRLRETPAAHGKLAATLEELEQKAVALALRHDRLAANTHVQLRQVFDAIRELISPPEPRRRRIGFITPEEK
jgi:hypothetical protein